MTRYTISNERYQKFNIDVRGTDLALVLYYNTTSDAWYVDVFRAEGEVLIYGEKMVSGVDLGFKFEFRGVYVADGEGNFRDPDSNNWDNLFLYILDEDELEDAPRANIPEPTYLIDAGGNPLVDGNGYNLVVE